MSKLPPFHRSNQSLPSLLSESTTTTSTTSYQSSDHEMILRRGGVSHRSISPTCVRSRQEAVEGGKSLKRRAVRRYAITKYSQIPLDRIKSLRKRVDLTREQDNESLVNGSLPFEEISPNHQGSLIVFDLLNNLDSERQGSKDFLSLLNLYHEEKYQYAESETHKSILRSIILDEMKSQGYKFVKKDLLRPNHFYVLDNFHAIKLIKDQLHLIGQSNKTDTGYFT